MPVVPMDNVLPPQSGGPVPDSTSQWMALAHMDKLGRFDPALSTPDQSLATDKVVKLPKRGHRRGQATL